MMRKDQDSFRKAPGRRTAAAPHEVTNPADPANPADEAAAVSFDAAHDATFEFRVLAGLHAGARFAWPPATDATLLVGAHAACDIVLQDAALAAHALRIRIAPDRRGWLARDVAAPERAASAIEGAGDAADDTDAPLAFGQVWVRSGLALTVAIAGTRWPRMRALRPGDADAALREPGRAADMPDAVSPAAASGAPPADATMPGAAEPQTSNAAPPAAATRARTATRSGAATREGHAVSTARKVPALPVTDAATPRSGSRRNPRRVGFYLSIGAIALAVPFLVLLASLSGARRHAGPPPAAPAHALAAPNQSPGAVTKLLERLGLAERLHLGTTEDGLIAVAGWVADGAQRDALADALAQLTPMPAMRVLIESEAVATAQQLAQTFGATIDARYDGDGRIALSGAIDDDARRDALRQAFREQLPGAVLIDGHLLARAALEQALRETLGAAGITGARVAWTTAGLEADAPASTDADRFERALAGFRRVYGRRLPLLARMGAAAAPFVATGLPFAIVSVTGGALPSVVVAGGGRLLPGGKYRDYRLVTVEAARIVFDGPRRVIVAR